MMMMMNDDNEVKVEGEAYIQSKCQYKSLWKCGQVGALNVEAGEGFKRLVQRNRHPFSPVARQSHIEPSFLHLKHIHLQIHTHVLDEFVKYFGSTFPTSKSNQTNLQTWKIFPHMGWWLRAIWIFLGISTKPLYLSAPSTNEDSRPAISAFSFLAWICSCCTYRTASPTMEALSICIHTYKHSHIIKYNFRRIWFKKRAEG